MMRKIEIIWHHLLYKALTAKRYKWTQQELAEDFHYSLSTVHYALKVPSQMGIVRKTARFFVLEDFDKLLYYWASVRKLEKDLIYSTHLDEPIREIEGLVLPQGIYAGYSAATLILEEPPADYSKVYFYYPREDMEKVRERFPLNPTRPANVFVLERHPAMSRYGQLTTIPQTFVDIWNLGDWYSRDFTQALEKKIHALLP
jgi:hypothetical protein